MITTKKIKQCRVCQNPNLIPCIDIGNQYLSSVFPTNLKYKKIEKKYPLSMVLCKKTKTTCGTLQLNHIINLDSMYEHYPYLSSTNSSMKKILEDVVFDATKIIHITKDDTVLDIGGNDGTLLSYLRKTNATLISIDPAKNIPQVFSSKKYKYINSYYSKGVFSNVSKQKAKAIFSIAMFYHLSNPVEFSKEVADCLSDDGIWIIQMAYLPSMLQTNMYDNIVHEHAVYYTLHNMKWIMDKVGLEIFDTKLNDVYGGSFRIFIKHKGNKKIKVQKRVKEILDSENKIGVNKIGTYKKFMKEITKTKEELKKLIKRLKKDGKTIWVYGASTKGNTILQFCDLSSREITAAADSNPYKFNKYMIGSDIPIKTEDEMRKAKPDYLLSLPYSFTKTFIDREHDLVRYGTQFIIPLPQVKISP